MSALRLPRFEIDRAYDLRVLAALAPTLGLFSRASLRTQLHEMTAQRRAICFTLMTPVSRRKAANDDGQAVATILACLHVAPVLASEGLEAVLKIVVHAAEVPGDPIHELAAPIPEAGSAGAGFYREAIYLEGDTSIAITTHTPPRLPAEAMQAVAALIRETPVDAMTTIAVAPLHPDVATLAGRTAAARPTLH
jgi:hypothetical protein